MNGRQIRILAIGAVTFALTACGGGGGTEVASTPPPPVNPTPTPTPPPTIPPVPAGAIGLQSPDPFATQAAYETASGTTVTGANAVQFSYSASDDTYTITIPGYEQGQLVTTGGNGSILNGAWQRLSSTNNDVTVGTSSQKQTVWVQLQWPADAKATFDLSYTNLGWWYDHASDARGVFAYGIPTSASNVPLSGTASYSGGVEGFTADGIGVGGSVMLSFDFGAGSLSGWMKPELLPWDAVPLGTYTFRDTVYSQGATTFSGAFDVPGTTAASSFQGSFNGPQAAEFMANWSAPYIDPQTQQSGAMSGVWFGTKN